MKFRSFAIAALSLAWSACSVDNDPVSKVKDGVLEFDKGVTVGKAFDHYKLFETTLWKAFQTENGRQLVQVTGRIPVTNISQDELDLAVMATAKSAYDGERLRKSGASGELKKRLQGVDLIAQFQVNQDNTFEVYTIVLRRVDVEETRGQDVPLESATALTQIYQNEPIPVHAIVYALSAPNA